MRLGEVMITGGLITASELEAARARQRETGARLGTTLIELGVVETDDVARALGRQHGVPAALSRHLRDRDRTVAAYLPADLARELHALPVALSRGAAGANLVVCFRDPDPDIIAEVARVAGIPVIPSVACERVLERELRLAYPPPPAAQIATPTQPPPGPTTAQRMAPVSAELLVEREDTGSFDINVDDGGDDDAQGFGGLERLALVDLDDRRVSRDHSQSVLLPAMRDGGQSQNLRADPGRSATIPPSSPSGVFAAVTADGVSRVPAPSASNPALRPPAGTTTPPPTNPALRPTATTPLPATNPALRPTATSATPPATNPALRRVESPGTPPATQPALRRIDAPATPPATNPALRPTAATTPPPATQPALRRIDSPASPPATTPALRRVESPSVPRTVTPPAATPSVPRTVTQPLTSPSIPRTITPAPASYFHPAAAGPTTTVEGSALCIGPRDLVAERFLPHLISSWRIAVVLAVEHGAVTPCTGVGGALTPAILEGTETSLAGSSILRNVVEARRPHVGDAAGPGGIAREPWLYGLINAGRELVVAPVIVGDRVVRIIVAVGARLEIGVAAGEVLRVARTMVDAYTRGSQPRSG